MHDFKMEVTGSGGGKGPPATHRKELKGLVYININLSPIMRSPKKAHESLYRMTKNIEPRGYLLFGVQFSMSHFKNKYKESRNWVEGLVGR